MNKPRWAIIAHGGAKDIPGDQQAAHRQGLLAAIAIGQRLLAQGGSAVDTVEAVVRELEDNPIYNAGTGSVRNAAGEIEMDASIMDGATLDVGAVAGIQDIAHPVSVARALLREKSILLVGEGAAQFARERGFAPPPAETRALRAASGGDTVGCVALDRQGNLAVATSTGGLEGAQVGRVGDVPMPGCGFYADNRRGAVSTSGEGEAIARVMLAGEFLRVLQAGAPKQAMANALDAVSRIPGGEAGIIAITPQGDLLWDHNSANFAVGLATDQDGTPRAYTQKSEE